MIFLEKHTDTETHVSYWLQYHKMKRTQPHTLDVETLKHVPRHATLHSVTSNHVFSNTPANKSWPCKYLKSARFCHSFNMLDAARIWSQLNGFCRINSVLDPKQTNASSCLRNDVLETAWSRGSEECVRAKSGLKTTVSFKKEIRPKWLIIDPFLRP